MHSLTAKFDLTLELEETPNGIEGWFECSADLFDAPTIARMAGHFLTLLEGIVANPEQRLWELPVLTEAERHQMLVEWNSTGTEIPDICTHQLFEAQVERTPDASAAVFEDAERRVASLQYRQLNERANQLDCRLQALGVGPEALVAICALAIARHACRASRHPQSRRRLCATRSRLSPRAPGVDARRLRRAGDPDSTAPGALPEHQAQIVCLDADWKAIAQQSTDKPQLQARPTSIAYVIYTSGSTGKPKGVQIPHSAVVNFLRSMQIQPGLTEQDILLSVTTLSFDIAALELFLPLSAGARVAIVSRDIASDGKRLLETLASTGATVMQATPVTWRMLLQAGKGQMPAAENPLRRRKHAHRARLRASMPVAKNSGTFTDRRKPPFGQRLAK